MYKKFSFLALVSIDDCPSFDLIKLRAVKMMCLHAMEELSLKLKPLQLYVLDNNRTDFWLRVGRVVVLSNRESEVFMVIGNPMRLINFSELSSIFFSFLNFFFLSKILNHFDVLFNTCILRECDTIIT